MKLSLSRRRLVSRVGGGSVFCSRVTVVFSIGSCLGLRLSCGGCSSEAWRLQVMRLLGSVVYGRVSCCLVKLLSLCVSRLSFLFKLQNLLASGLDLFGPLFFLLPVSPA